MSSINNIRTLSFCLETAKKEINFNYYTLRIPHRWQEMIWGLKDAASKAGNIRQPSAPVLNQLLTALFPH